jgi:hypothetical protein
VFSGSLQMDDHQENPSAIIVGCRVYNWVANSDLVVTTAIQWESVCSSAGRLRPDHTKYELGSNSAQSCVGSFCDFSLSDRFLTSFVASSLSCQPPPCSAISPLLLHITFPATASHSLQHSPVMWTHCCLSIACKPSSPHCLRHALVGIVLLPTCGI